jgi:hypothetical protein
LKDTNLIIGIAANYDRFNISIFVESLRNTGCLDEVVLFETNFTEKCYDFCKKNNISTIKINSEYPWFVNKELSLNLRNIDPTTPYPAHYIRFFLIEAFLKTSKKYNKIIISDVRDVFFQKNPFKTTIKNNELQCFLESEKVTISEEPINAAWVINGYTKRGLKEIKNECISCCGVIVGGTKAIIRYTKIMCNEFERLSNSKVIIGFDGVMEQAIHNYLLRKGNLDPVEIIEDDFGLVSTLSYFKPKNDIHLNSFNQITNSDKTVIPIVHQYDRFPDIEKKILKSISLKTRLLNILSKKAKWIWPFLKKIF